MARILITPRSLTAAPHRQLDRLRDAGFDLVFCAAGKTPDEAALRRLVPGCVGWLAGVEPVSPAVIAAADALRVISRNGSGVDNLPLADLAERGIAVRKADGANAAGVAELAIGLMFAGLRQIIGCDRGIKGGQWPRPLGREVRGREVGVIGCGAVGAEVVRLATALGAEVLGYDPVQPAFAVPQGRFRWADLATVISHSDVLSLHCPAPKDGRTLLDADAIGRMRPGAIVVNTARAALVDEQAMLAALDAGHLAAYATDVFPTEPPRPLGMATHPRVIATSHVGGLTEESVERAAAAAVDNLLAVLA
jgi:D-3-phosphoglycerate dehydrogenase / 2-oxoglutarate reductase